MKEYHLKRTLLYEQIVDELYGMIDSGEVKLGEQFPSERELIARWGISRNVLREAFHVLEDRDIVAAKQGKGRFLRALPVKEISPEEKASRQLERYTLLDIYVTRQCLESKAVELIAENATDADIEEIDEFYQREICEKFHNTKSTEGEFEIHRLYAEKSKNRFLYQLLNYSCKINLELMKGTFHDKLVRHRAEDSILDHGEIIRALRARDGEKAKAIMTAHMQHTINMLKDDL